jgi:hypothetical protein
LNTLFQKSTTKTLRLFLKVCRCTKKRVSRSLIINIRQV